MNVVTHIVMSQLPISTIVFLQNINLLCLYVYLTMFRNMQGFQRQFDKEDSDENNSAMEFIEVEVDVEKSIKIVEKENGSRSRYALTILTVCMYVIKLDLHTYRLTRMSIIKRRSW